MKLRDFMQKLSKLTILNPEALELDVVSSGDDEGNYFNEVYFDPCVGVYNDDLGEFDAVLDGDKTKPNAVCIN